MAETPAPSAVQCHFIRMKTSAAIIRKSVPANQTNDARMNIRTPQTTAPTPKPRTI